MLLTAFDSDEREAEFLNHHRKTLRGYGDLPFAIRTAAYYALHPWRIKEALYLYQRKRELFPGLQPAHHMQGGQMIDRAVAFSRELWEHWDGRQMVIPDIASSVEKFVESVERGNAVCKSPAPNMDTIRVNVGYKKTLGWKPG